MRVALIVVLLAGVAGALGLARYGLRRGRAAEAFVIDRLPPKQAYDPRARWSVTEYFAAHHVLTVQVETTALDEALTIAQRIAGPVSERYIEILIYFHRPGRPDVLPPKRVQWTAGAGYVETLYE